MKRKTSWGFLFFVIYLSVFWNPAFTQPTIDTLTSRNTSINLGLGNGEDGLGNSYTYTIGQLSGKALVRPDRSYEIGFLHCLPCIKEVVNSRFPDLEGKLKIFPNPASSVIHVEYELAQELNYRLINTRGEILIMGTVNKTEHLSITQFPEGLYLLAFYNKNGELVYMEKIAKID